MEDDVTEVLLADLGVAGTYQSKGAGPALPFVVQVTPAVPSVRKPELLQSVGQGRSHKVHLFKLMMASVTAAELAADNPPLAGTVSASGGVVQLLPGDVITVPGSAVQRPKVATVSLTVQEGTPRLLYGHWTCEGVA